MGSFCIDKILAAYKIAHLMPRWRVDIFNFGPCGGNTVGVRVPSSVPSTSDWRFRAARILFQSNDPRRRSPPTQARTFREAARAGSEYMTPRPHDMAERTNSRRSPKDRSQARRSAKDGNRSERCAAVAASG